MGKHIKKHITNKRRPLKRKKIVKTINNQQPINNKQVNDQTTLRNMLLMKAGLITPGFIPQQYGNVNDKINSLQVAESTMKQQNMQQKQQIEELNRNIAELRKEKHDVDTKHYRAENEYDKLRMELDELERVKGKTDALKEKINTLRKRIEEIELDDSIKKLTEQRDEMQRAYDQKSYENKFLSEQIEANKLKGELDNLVKERKLIETKNKGAQKYLNSKDFTNTTERIVEEQRKLLQAQEEAKYNEELIKLRRQNQELMIQKNSLPDVTVINSDIENAIQQQIDENTKLEEEIYSRKRHLNRLNKRREELDKLDNDNEALNYTNYSLASQINAYRNVPKKTIEESIKRNANSTIEKEQLDKAVKAEQEYIDSSMAKEEAKEELRTMKSSQFQQQEEQLANTIIATQNNERVKQQLDIQAKAEGQMQKSLMELKIKQQNSSVPLEDNTNELALTNQIQQLTEEETKAIAERESKERTINALFELIQQRDEEHSPNTWEKFIKEYPKYAQVLNSSYSLQENFINEAYQNFMNYEAIDSFDDPSHNVMNFEEEEEENQYVINEDT